MKRKVDPDSEGEVFIYPEHVLLDRCQVQKDTQTLHLQ